MPQFHWSPRAVWVLSVLVSWALVGTSPSASEATSPPTEYGRLFSLRPEPDLSTDGNTLHGGVRPVIFVADPNPAETRVRSQGLEYSPGLDLPSAAQADARRPDPPDTNLAAVPAATFSIQYVPAGGSDTFDQTCLAFPETAKAAFNAATAVWSGILRSSVPITLRACWADLGSSSTLGYSGGGSLHRNFAGAPHTNTWYSASLANALAGSDLDPSNEDIHLTFNSGFPWYYGTDGNTPSDLYDLTSVVLHEIGHGLNFSGSMNYFGGFGFWGYYGSPEIYDTFMRNGVGISLTTYSSGSQALGSQLVSDDVWFHGAEAMAANGGTHVKIYAPVIWQAGSSYSHLDYNTFNDTEDQLMVHAISPGESIQDPGGVTRGLLQDLGWTLSPRSAPDFVITAITLGPVMPQPSSLDSATLQGKHRRNTLAIAEWLGVSSSEPVDGSSFRAQVTVTNQGTVPGDGGYLEVWTDQPMTETCGATGVQRRPVGRVAPGASIDIFFSNLQEGTGNQSFRAFVDSGCSTTESNEDNNQFTLSYTVGESVPRPDFVVTQISLSPTTPEGQRVFSATVTVQNQGAVAGGGNWLRVWPHEPAAQGCGAVSSRAMWLDNLAPGESRSLTFVGLPAGEEGAKTFRAFVDSDCDAAEASEANNQLTQGYSVSAAGPSASS